MVDACIISRTSRFNCSAMQFEFVTESVVTRLVFSEYLRFYPPVILPIIQSRLSLPLKCALGPAITTTSILFGSSLLTRHIHELRIQKLVYIYIYSYTRSTTINLVFSCPKHIHFYSLVVQLADK